MQITPRRRARSHHYECGFRKPCDGEVCLDAAARIQPLRVDNFANTDAHVVGAEVVEIGFGISPLNTELGETGHIIQRNRLTRGHMFGGGMFKPVLSPIGIVIFRLYALWREPIGALPASGLAKTSAMRRQALMNW